MGGDPKLGSQTYLIPEAHNQQATQFSQQSALASVAFSQTIDFEAGSLNPMVVNPNSAQSMRYQQNTQRQRSYNMSNTISVSQEIDSQDFMPPPAGIDLRYNDHTASIFNANEVTQKRKLDIKFDQDMKILEQIIKERAERRLANNQL